MSRSSESGERVPQAPDHDRQSGHVALLLIDLINDFSFPGGKELHDRVMGALEPIRSLRDAVEAAGGVTIYVNDNFGEWHSDKSRLVARAIEKGSVVARELRPRDDDYFIIKPQFSGFYATNLPVLLPKLGADRLILAGTATDICVLFTAADAHMRDYALWVPSDANVAEGDDRHRWALEIMAQSMGAETEPTSQLTVSGWLDRLNASSARRD
ncbi:MAG: isochorismatase family cysteine hydrolase [Sphingomonas sp.]